MGQIIINIYIFLFTFYFLLLLLILNKKKYRNDFFNIFNIAIATEIYKFIRGKICAFNLYKIQFQA